MFRERREIGRRKRKKKEEKKPELNMENPTPQPEPTRGGCGGVPWEAEQTRSRAGNQCGWPY